MDKKSFNNITVSFWILTGCRPEGRDPSKKGLLQERATVPQNSIRTIKQTKKRWLKSDH
ncbi:hypothetical protein RhiirA5_410053 [Rhizophagus irregularis]|uniref:Lipoprotein n=1 Tax=Rhizophagus irregularis TaxID=588596 RepID=A0A2N0Q4A2_9GLOM|nr:hypothetical protein RhiirA5_410053 [Rhizophagus irregularis]